jgi:predicted Zn-dependent protease
MRWCALCSGDSPLWGRRRFLAALGQAALVAGLPSRSSAIISIIDEAGDVKIGREADPEILKQMGYYDGPDLQQYVAQVGQRVVAVSDTRFSFQFKVVDQTYINAFALPGGFIYVTRGMLAGLNDEAQLAGVLGHEITHVNSRHGAQMLTKALGAQLASLVGIGAAAAAGSGQAIGAVAMITNHLTTYMLLGYGREFEMEADEVGLRHAHKAGYDPMQTVAFFRDLRRQEFLRGQPTYHGFDSTHPDTAARISKAYAMASLLVTQGGALAVKADTYKEQLDRMVYGEARDRLRLRIYTVKPGDTLESVARDQLQDAGRRYELASLNGLRDDAVPPPGSRLKLIVRQGETEKRQELQLEKQ